MDTPHSGRLGSVVVPRPSLLETGVAQAISPDADDIVDVKNLLTVLRERASLLISTVIMVTGLTALIAINLTPQYTATSAVLIEPREVRVISMREVIDDKPEDRPMMETKINLLLSTSFARQIMEELHILDDREFNEPMDYSGWFDEHTALRALADESLTALVHWTSELWLAATELAERIATDGFYASGADDQSALARAPAQATADLKSATLAVASQAPGADLPHGGTDQSPMDAAIALFLDNLQVRQEGDSYVISIAFTSSDPAKAALVANTVAERFVANQLRAKQLATTNAADWLNARIRQLREQLLKSEQAVETYRAEKQLFPGEGKLKLGEQELASLQDKLIDVQADRADKDAKRSLIQELDHRGDLQLVGEVMTSPMFKELRLEQARLLQERAQLAQEYGRRHPKIVQIQAELGNVSAKIQAEIANMIKTLDNELALDRIQEEMINEKLQLAKTRSLAQNQAEVRLRLLQGEAEATRALYTTFLNRFKELSEQRDLLEPGVRVVSTATPPAAPSFPRLSLMLAAGFTGSLLLGSALALLAHRLDSRLRTGRQIEHLMGIPNIAMIPRVARRRCRNDLYRYLFDKPQSRYAESIKSIEACLLHADKHPQVILVTSSTPEEGKTTLTLGLGTSLARSGHRTVVVELDLRRPTIANKLRPPTKISRGLLEYLTTNKTTINDIVYESTTPRGLDVITVERPASLPTNLILSERMAYLIMGLRRRYRYIILDTPPALGMADSKFATIFADAILFVVRWGIQRNLPIRAARLFMENRDRNIWAVLSQVDVRQQRKYGYTDVAHYYKKYDGYYTD